MEPQVSTTSGQFYGSVQCQHNAVPKKSVRVAQYVRMSTEQQCFSTLNQLDAIAKYADANGMTVIRTFSDEGRSGLTLDQRPGLRSLLSMVQQGLADFKAVLVYDVSRWGRFQDADESGYWEYVCKRAGVQVHYCAEPFNNDCSLPSVIFKGLKRTMAAEYSRELSIKVFAGQCRLVDLGYHLGGPSGFGLRRLLVDAEGNAKEFLQPGQLKSIQNDRVILVPGPEAEQEIVREIFRAFVDLGLSQSEIARNLNARGISRGSAASWRPQTIHEILVNPKYMGTSVFNRRSQKLSTRVIHNSPELWIRKDKAFPAIVPPALFERASQILANRRRAPTESELLEQLRSILAREGRLTGALIDKSNCIRHSSYLWSHFGGLRQLYQKLGYDSAHTLSFVRCKPQLKPLAVAFLHEVTSRLRGCGALVEMDWKSHMLRVNRSLRLRLSLTRCLRVNGRTCWCLPNKWPQCDALLTARLDKDNGRILDYVVLPANHRPNNRFISLKTSSEFEVYRFDTLDNLCQVCRRASFGG